MTPCASPWTRPPHPLIIEPIVRHALEEDLGRGGDITSDLIVPAGQEACARLVVRAGGTLAGLVVAERAFVLFDGATAFEPAVSDGASVAPNQTIATVRGPARAMLGAERVALNFLGHLSGIASATREWVNAVAHTKARIVCTRKTTPGLRVLEKYAVRCGGGSNHRFGLDDAVLIKDNHISAAGGVRAAAERVRQGLGHMTKIEIEVDTIAQLDEALALGIDVILLDNMHPEDLRQAVKLSRGRAILEASGGITIGTVRAVAETGVDYISAGAITHSAPNLDVALDF
jgi:nicotinate-nucleotide pyrophosphorylase (carboxylating)